MRLSYFLVLVACGCERPEPPTEPVERPRPSPMSSSSLREALADAAADVALDAPSAAAVSALRAVREKLPVASRVLPAQRLALGRNRIGVLLDDALLIRDTATLATNLRLSIHQPRRLAVLADGALLVAGREATYLVGSGKKDVESLPKLTMFPDSVLYADRRDPRMVWVLHPTARSLYEYRLDRSDAGLLGIARFVTLEGYTGRGFVSLADGSFAFWAGSELRRLFPGGRSWRFTSKDSSAGRLEHARRIDELWWAPSDGALERLSLAGGLKRVARLEFTFSVFDFVAQGDSLALIAIDRPGGGARRWRLVVLGSDGTRRFAHPLEADPMSTAEDWARGMTRNLHLALSPDGRLVSVGGPDRIGVWETATGRRLGP